MMMSFTARLLMAIGRVVEVWIMVCGMLPACVTHDMKKTRHLCHQETGPSQNLVGLPTPLVQLGPRSMVLGLATPAPSPTSTYVRTVARDCRR